MGVLFNMSGKDKLEYLRDLREMAKDLVAELYDLGKIPQAYKVQALINRLRKLIAKELGE